MRLGCAWPGYVNSVTPDMITVHLQFSPLVFWMGCVCVFKLCYCGFHHDHVCVDSELPDAYYLLGRDWWNYYHRLLGLPVLLLQV